MKEKSSLQGSQAECNDKALPEKFHNSPCEEGHSESPYFRGRPPSRQDSGPAFEFNDLINEEAYDDSTNDVHQYNFPNLDKGSERSFSQQPRRGDDRQTVAGRNGEEFLRSVQMYAEVSSPSCRSLVPNSGDVPAQPNLQRPLASAPSGSPPSMPTNSYYHTKNASRPSQRASQYSYFGGRFPDPASASLFRKAATRFDRKPYRPPDTDHSIEDIDRDRHYHVERIYNAMTCGDAARDNNGSIAMKRWVHAAYYDSSLVEAYAHKVFDCLILQVREGFRGWEHNDYVADDRKGEDEDRDASCAERLNNIIRALEEEKTICEDVMNSACQIRMFVNAPKAYANRKYQNRVGNSKRGRPKDATSDAGERPSKVRKSNPRPTARPRASSSLLSSRDTRYASQNPVTPLQQHPQPCYATPPTQYTASSAANVYPRATPGLRPSMTAPQAHSSNRNQFNPLSPPPVHVPYLPRMTSVPAVQHSPHLSPPPLSVGHYSAPVTPDEATLDAPNNSSPYTSMHSFGPLLYSTYPIDQALFSEGLEWPSADQTCSPPSTSHMVQNLDPALFSPTQQSSAARPDSDFQEFWARQQGVQQTPYQQLPDKDNLNQHR